MLGRLFRKSPTPTLEVNRVSDSTQLLQHCELPDELIVSEDNTPEQTSSETPQPTPDPQNPLVIEEVTVTEDKSSEPQKKTSESPQPTPEPENDELIVTEDKSSEPQKNPSESPQPTPEPENPVVIEEVTGTEDKSSEPQENPSETPQPSSEPQNPVVIEEVTVPEGSNLENPDPVIPFAQQFDAGIFTVDETGQVNVDFLADGRKYRGQLAMINVEGMEQFDYGTTEFIQEAARRALSDSPLGRIIISDRDEGARFNKQFFGKYNRSNYLGNKTFDLQPGGQYAFMLIPKGKMKSVLKRPVLNKVRSPLFSFEQEQMASLSGGAAFAWEDLDVEKRSDADFNDLIFRVEGVTGEAVTSVEEAINPSQDWRETEAGREVLDYLESIQIPQENETPQDVKLLVDAVYNPGETLSFPGLVADEDGGSDIARVDFWLQQDGGEWVDISDAVTFTSDHYDAERAKFNYELEGLDPGRYQLKAVAYDSTGAAGEESTHGFTVLSVPEDAGLSDRTRMAIERSLNLNNYNPNALSQATQWVVSVNSSIAADELAAAWGATNLGATGEIPNTYTFQFTSGLDPYFLTSQLNQDAAIEFAYPLVPMYLDFYGNPEDEPLVKDGTQWHLRSGIEPEADANVTQAWQSTTGEGVVIGVVDDGFEYQHSDLSDNYRSELSYDFDEYDGEPTPRLKQVQVDYHDWTDNWINDEANYFQVGVPASGDVAQLTLTFDLWHDAIADLDISLKSPHGTVIPLENIGGPSYSAPLHGFTGENAQGYWTLIIEKNESVANGLLDSFSLTLDTYNGHGTRVAGVATAHGENSFGGSGVAPNAHWAGLRMGSTAVTEYQITDALSHYKNDIDIYNNSWGQGFYSAALPNVENLFANVEDGRNGAGNIYVFAAGNDRIDPHTNNYPYGNVNYNSLANARQTIAVGAIDHHGEQTVYSTPGAALLVSAYSGDGTTDITTTSVNNSYVDDFSGTSASAPFVSGVVALMLEANPNLTWRDVQTILIETAQPENGNQDNLNDPNDPDWVQNGAGYWVNHKYGFGAVDAQAAVEKATNWTLLNQETKLSQRALVAQAIPKYNPNDPLTSTITLNPQDNLSVEWVEVGFSTQHRYIGDLEITLISPDGTESVLSEQHFHHSYNHHNYQEKVYHWTFTSARHWGESASGEWELQVRDKHNGNGSSPFFHNIWKSWSLNLYGTSPNTPPEFKIVTNTNDSGAGSLRAVLEWANANPGTDLISFNIPTTDPGYNATTNTFTIQPLSALPKITDAIILDATTQPGLTNKPMIELDGSLAGNETHGLHIRAGDSTVKGFVINRFDRQGIYLDSADNNIIQGNYIGTDVTGTKLGRNGGNGIYMASSSGNLIGGATSNARNIISGNESYGVSIYSSKWQKNFVQGNYIGTDITGKKDLGNNKYGVVIGSSSNNVIGGINPGEGNIIAYNGWDGVRIKNNNATTINNSVLSNSIFGNKYSGITLGKYFNQSLQNDEKDIDEGENHLQNHPNLVSVNLAENSIEINGNFNSTPNKKFRLEFFGNPNNDGEGKNFLGSQKVTTDSNGNANFNIFLSNVAADRFVTATATDSQGNTSEFSNAIRIVGTPNNSPTLTNIDLLSGVVGNQPFKINYEDLLAASNAADTDGDKISFLIQSVNSGTLTKNGKSVISGVTTLSPGEVLIGEYSQKDFIQTMHSYIPAFTVTATDGIEKSQKPVDVTLSSGYYLTQPKIEQFSLSNANGLTLSVQGYFPTQGWTLNPVTHERDGNTFKVGITALAPYIGLTAIESFSKDIVLDSDIFDTENSSYKVIINDTITTEISLTSSTITSFNTNPYTNPYQSETDSPFYTHPNLILEDFEDGLLNTPGVTASTGTISNTTNTVDSLTGQSWRISENTLTLTFDDTVLGIYPIDVGVAITDIETNNGTGTVRLEAWDAQGVFLGATQPQDFGDGLTNGSTAEDRFLGISHDNGISKVTLSTDSTNWELDHLQYVV
ncbi:S8 family serine peptidase [Spirulina sp. CS-785/01]|uniref:S8 family serine peptidase n=1 Tax=Spirulina sp. CS-785/01 TaxID=3021716 RepID=UPI00232C528F|nr:S8 family serine peptidase [Spirulina sp. CS-785/01]MDB9313625.1 S8 family serine peptidase [Spirulina sp. CS-785/01]